MASIASGKTTITLITADNCEPCEKAKPSFTLIRTALGTLADFHELNIRDLPASYLQPMNVRGAPSVLFHNDGILEHVMTKASDEFKNLGIAVSSYIDGCIAEDEDTIDCEACQ
jgi:thiol-disulfide isomerase/thioredoxin